MNGTAGVPLAVVKARAGPDYRKRRTGMVRQLSGLIREALVGPAEIGAARGEMWNVVDRMPAMGTKGVRKGAAGTTGMHCHGMGWEWQCWQEKWHGSECRRLWRIQGWNGDEEAGFHVGGL